MALSTLVLYRDLNGEIGLRTIEWWCQMIRRFDSVKLSSSCFARTKDNIQKVKQRRKKRVSARKTINRA